MSAPISVNETRASRLPPTHKLTAGTLWPRSITASARSSCRYSSSVRAWTARAREVVPGSDVLSMMRGLTPTLLSQSERTRPVGPAPTTRTSLYAIPCSTRVGIPYRVKAYDHRRDLRAIRLIGAANPDDLDCSA